MFSSINNKSKIVRWFRRYQNYYGVFTRNNLQTLSIWISGSPKKSTICKTYLSWHYGTIFLIFIIRNLLPYHLTLWNICDGGFHENSQQPKAVIYAWQGTKCTAVPGCLKKILIHSAGCILKITFLEIPQNAQQFLSYFIFSYFPFVSSTYLIFSVFV